MKPDDFEQQLRQQPLRPVPSGWREPILAAARAAARSQRSNLIGPCTPWWREWLWPCPQAWAGLAAVWLLLLVFRLAPATSASTLAQRPSASPEVQMALAAQRREMIRLLDGPVESTPAPKPPPGPRSDVTSPIKA